MEIHESDATYELGSITAGTGVEVDAPYKFDIELSHQYKIESGGVTIDYPVEIILTAPQSESFVAGQKRFVDAMLETLDDRLDQNIQDTIDPRGNLNYEALANILVAVGVTEIPYATKKVMINEKLLSRRNSVAHGDFLPIEDDEYPDLHTQILALIDRFRRDLENAADNRSYLRQPQATWSDLTWVLNSGLPGFLVRRVSSRMGAIGPIKAMRGENHAQSTYQRD